MRALRLLRPSPKSSSGSTHNFRPLSSHLLSRPPAPATTRSYTMQHSIPASYYRGGTSRALMFRTRDLPASASERSSLFLQAMGTPDPNGRQLDGFGAGISSLSKICLVGKVSASEHPGITADVTYTFVGLGIETAVIDTAGNCGNMSSAIGPFAFNERMLAEGYDYRREGEATVMVYNTNTGKYIRSTFPVRDGQAVVSGDYTIDGVHGGGAKIRLDFLDPAGAKTGKLLPTGNVVDVIEGLEISCVDSANPMVFVRARDIGVQSTILPNEFMKEKQKFVLLDRIRRQAAVKMGMAGTIEDVPRVIPKIAIVAEPETQVTLSGTEQGEGEMDVLVRFISDELPHRAIPLTGALCTVSAARIKGTVVNICTRQDALEKGGIRIAHASGTIEVGATLDEEGNVTEATVYRTAKRLMDGQVYYSK